MRLSRWLLDGVGMQRLVRFLLLQRAKCARASAPHPWIRCFFSSTHSIDTPLLQDPMTTLISTLSSLIREAFGPVTTRRPILFSTRSLRLSRRLSQRLVKKQRHQAVLLQLSPSSLTLWLAAGRILAEYLGVRQHRTHNTRVDTCIFQQLSRASPLRSRDPASIMSSRRCDTW